jgi:putative chitinase
MSPTSTWRARLATRRALHVTAEHKVDYWRARWRAEEPGTPERSRAYRMLVQAKRRLALRAAQVAEAVRGVRRDQALDWRALQRVCPMSAAEARDLACALGPAFARFGITTPGRAAMAVAQFAHESAGFTTTTEFASGAGYEGRRDLGNVIPGDGRRFKGRGYIQITGRANYKAVSQAFGVDFLARPELLAAPRYAALASCWWWDSHGCNELADTGDVRAVTRRINGGENGLAERRAYFARASAVAGSLVPGR